VGWRNCLGWFPARWRMGRFPVQAARNREIEGPSQQCSSQIPLRCLPGKNPRNTGFRPTSGRMCSDQAFRNCLVSPTLAGGILVPDLGFFNGAPGRLLKLRSCATGFASVNSSLNTMRNLHWQSQWHTLSREFLIAGHFPGAAYWSNNSQDLA